MKRATHHFRFGTHVGSPDGASAATCDEESGPLHQLTLFERTTFDVIDVDARHEKGLGITTAGGRHGLT
jgi:hypothetical protein